MHSDIEAMTKYLDQVADSSPETWTRRTAIRRIAAAFSAAAAGSLLRGSAKEARGAYDSYPYVSYTSYTYVSNYRSSYASYYYSYSSYYSSHYYYNSPPSPAYD